MLALYVSPVCEKLERMVSLKTWLIKNNYNFLLVTEDPDVDPEGFVRTCEGVDRIIVVGGMGTLGLIVNLTYHLNVPYGILPVSEKNDFAGILGLNGLDDDELFEALVVPGRTKDVDAWAVNGKKLFVSSFMMGASTVYGKYDNEGDKPEFIKDLKGVHGSLTYKIKSDNRNDKCKLSTIAVLNTPTIGNGLIIDSESKVNDGFVDVVCVKRPLLFRSAFNKNSLREDGLSKQGNVQVLKTPKIIISCDQEVECMMDGVVCRYQNVEICKVGAVRFAKR